MCPTGGNDRTCCRAIRSLPIRSRRGSFRLLSAVAAVVLFGGCQSSSTVTPGAAQGSVVPSAPTGWTTVFGDGFAGEAGSAPAAANWFYDIGTGYGTGEIEQTTSSTQNVYLDGHGHLVLKATRSGGTWRSARIESTRDDFAAPAGGELEMTASIEQPSSPGGLGYWPAFWSVGSPMRTGGAWPASGEIDMMEDVNQLNKAAQTLIDAAGSSGRGLIACPASQCASGYHTYSVTINRSNTKAEYLQFLIDGRVTDTITEAMVGSAAWKQAIDHGFVIVFDLAMGGAFPNGECGCTTPTASTSPGASMRVAYVAVYEKGGNSTPTGRAITTGEITGIHGLCLANRNGLNTEGNPIAVRACDHSAGQLWSVYSDGTLRAEGGCLDVSGGMTNGSWTDWYPCTGSSEQRWIPTSNGELVNPKSGLCLTDPGGNTAARLVIATCTGTAAQRWSTPAKTNAG